MKKINALAVFTIILVALTLFTFTVPKAQAVDVKIGAIFPASKHGKVGDQVRIIGSTNTTDSLYRLWFGNQVIIEKNSTGTNVDATFTVPQLPTGNYTLLLQDVTANKNDTNSFYIDTAYYLKTNTPTPPQLWQENSTITISANITGGKANTVYVANVTVKVPTPANQTYWALITLTNTTNNGEAHNLATIYPTNFQTTAHTNYTGIYTIALNRTLATVSFQLGLTNSTIYHRNQNVDIKAVGYKPNENTTLNIKYGTKTVHTEQNVTATTTGAIHTNWTIPSNASIGTYTVNVTSTSPSPTRKPTPDYQTFTVPGFDVNITTRNKALETVAGVTVRIFENAKSTVNATSDNNGFAQVELEIGNYTGEAYFRNKKVATQSATITNATTLYFDCNLTNLRVTVTDKIGTPLPEISIYVKPENLTLTTYVNGSAILHSLLPNVTYTLNASRYSMPFNLTTIPTLLVNGAAEAWFNVNITCPTRSMQISITDGTNQPINAARIRIQEIVGGSIYEGNTTGDGLFVFNGTFGKYFVAVHDAEGVELNSTIVNLFNSTTNVSLKCTLYGLNISIRVLDYFGQPIPNMNVTLHRESQLIHSTATQSNGIAAFTSITGGELEIAVYLPGQSQPSAATELNAIQSSTVDIKIDKYTMLAGMLIETNNLTTAVIIVAIVIVLLSLEVYRRKQKKQSKTS